MRLRSGWWASTVAHLTRDLTVEVAMPEENYQQKHIDTIANINDIDLPLDSEVLNELALFAGGGGGLLGSVLLGWKHACYVENNPYCVEVIKARIRDGYLCDAPIWGDIKTFDGRPWAGCVDIITAGFPCQPFSVARKQRGGSDDRNLWPETIRVIREVRPRYAFLENVPNLLVHEYARTIFGDLAESGYDCRWRIVSAADVGAPHLRKRLWILADSDGSAIGMDEYRSGGQERKSTGTLESEVLRQQNGKGGTEGIGTGRKDVANAQSTEGRRVLNQEIQANPRASRKWWECDPADAEDAAESQMGRVAHGIPHRVDRLKAIGNAQVPGVVRKAWELLTEGGGE